jgi:hypothetical protein
LQIEDQLFNNAVRKLGLADVDLEETGVELDVVPELSVRHPLHFVFAHDQHLKLLVLLKRFPKNLNRRRQIRLHIVQDDVLQTGVLIKFLDKELYALAVVCTAVRQVQCVQRLVLHYDKLQHLALELADVEAFELHHVQPALVADEGLTHVEEALRVHELTIAQLKLPQVAVVKQQVSKDLTVSLLVKNMVRYPNFLELHAEV